MSKILQCDNLCKSYFVDEMPLEILKDISFSVAAGETLSIVGSSGSGKSTLLHVLSGLDQSTSGQIYIDGEEISTKSDSEICAIRNQKIGFIYQFHHLLLEFTALENVLMPILIKRSISEKDKKFAKELLEHLGLSKRFSHYPAQLSGGERQRVAIARAVINNPKIVFADEPTGNLDNNTATQVLDIFFKLQQELNTSLIIVTHDENIAKKANKQYRLTDAKLVTAHHV